jgi:hypothetical protein
MLGSGELAPAFVGAMVALFPLGCRLRGVIARGRVGRSRGDEWRM